MRDTISIIVNACPPVGGGGAAPPLHSTMYLQVPVASGSSHCSSSSSTTTTTSSSAASSSSGYITEEESFGRDFGDLSKLYDPVERRLVPDDDFDWFRPTYNRRLWNRIIKQYGVNRYKETYHVELEHLLKNQPDRVYVPRRWVRENDENTKSCRARETTIPQLVSPTPEQRRYRNQCLNEERLRRLREGLPLPDDTASHCSTQPHNMIQCEVCNIKIAWKAFVTHACLSIADMERLRRIDDNHNKYDRSFLTPFPKTLPLHFKFVSPHRPQLPTPKPATIVPTQARTSERERALNLALLYQQVCPKCRMLAPQQLNDIHRKLCGAPTRLQNLVCKICSRVMGVAAYPRHTCAMPTIESVNYLLAHSDFKRHLLSTDMPPYFPTRGISVR